ncbi:MAG TPA: tetraacyldisaccharide 4'-kinase [Rhodocyclaceae bacterium]|nr:tetraacyldisaccharide 4'-kinase [Rhodocyclaceae bacterium]
MPSSRPSAERLLTAAWRDRGPVSTLLLPAAWAFAVLAALRRALYRAGWLARHRLPVPVVVIGGIVAGGTGKTPLIVALADALRAGGRHPGVVSRGYGRRGSAVRVVATDSAPADVGDEPLLIRRRTGCPVAVGADRVAAGRELLRANPDCDLVLCDDGLQHYRLWRDVEIAVVDARGAGNGRRLPAGPLREPVSRLADVDAIVLNGGDPAGRAAMPGAFRMTLSGEEFRRLDDPGVRRRAGDFAGESLVAVAGIGDPGRFFAHLSRLGLRFAERPFPDHHAYAAHDLALAADGILTTEKDAVKLTGIAPLVPAPGWPPVWVLPVTAAVEPDLARHILEKLDGCPPA